MNGYLNKRLLNPVYGARPSAHQSEHSRYAACLPQQARGDAHPLTLVREHASKGPCWTGYHRDYDRAKGTNDSCVKNGTKDKPMKKKKGEKKKKKEGDASSSSSSDSDDEKPKKKKEKKAETKD